MASTATGLNITVQLLLSGGYQGATVLNTPNLSLGYPSSSPKTFTYTFGTGSGQVNFAAEKVFSLVNATPQSIDLVSSATLFDTFGQAANLSSVKFIAIGNRSQTTGQTVTITGNAVTTGAIFGTVTNLVINPNEFRVLLHSPIDGKTVTQTSADTITLTSNANFSVDLVLLGIQI